MQRTFVLTAHRSFAVQPVKCGKPVGARRSLAGTPLVRGAANGTKCRAFFNFSRDSSGERWWICSLGPDRCNVLVIRAPYTPPSPPPPPSCDPTDQEPELTRDDFTSEEVTEYFNYMGMLAEEVRRGPFNAFKAVVRRPPPPPPLTAPFLPLSPAQGTYDRLDEMLACR